jgi:hypothetical protein
MDCESGKSLYFFLKNMLIVPLNEITELLNEKIFKFNKEKYIFDYLGITDSQIGEYELLQGTLYIQLPMPFLLVRRTKH